MNAPRTRIERSIPNGHQIVPPPPVPAEPEPTYEVAVWVTRVDSSTFEELPVALSVPVGEQQNLRRCILHVTEDQLGDMLSTWGSSYNDALTTEYSAGAGRYIATADTYVL